MKVTVTAEHEDGTVTAVSQTDLGTISEVISFFELALRAAGYHWEPGEHLNLVGDEL